jgi:KDO2-lipid IV(A) lauroyltransferase
VAIMLDVNRAFEAAVRRDPANWFWVHNRWKARGQPGRPHPHGAPQLAKQQALAPAKPEAHP